MKNLKNALLKLFLIDVGENRDFVNEGKVFYF
jgi:hypothetical protein